MSKHKVKVYDKIDYTRRFYPRRLKENGAKRNDFRTVIEHFNAGRIEGTATAWKTVRNRKTGKMERHVTDFVTTKHEFLRHCEANAIEAPIGSGVRV